MSFCFISVLLDGLASLGLNSSASVLYWLLINLSSQILFHPFTNLMSVRVESLVLLPKDLIEVLFGWTKVDVQTKLGIFKLLESKPVSISQADSYTRRYIVYSCINWASSRLLALVVGWLINIEVPWSLILFRHYLYPVRYLERKTKYLFSPLLVSFALLLIVNYLFSNNLESKLEEFKIILFQ